MAVTIFRFKCIIELKLICNDCIKSIRTIYRNHVFPCHTMLYIITTYRKQPAIHVSYVNICFGVTELNILLHPRGHVSGRDSIQGIVGSSGCAQKLM